MGEADRIMESIHVARQYELIQPRAKAVNLTFRVPGGLALRLAEARKEAEAACLHVDLSGALRAALEPIVTQIEEEIAQWKKDTVVTPQAPTSEDSGSDRFGL